MCRLWTSGDDSPWLYSNSDGVYSDGDLSKMNRTSDDCRGSE